MITVSKDTFLQILKSRPQWLTGKQIIYDGQLQKIDNVSVSGDYIFIDKGTLGKGWFPANSVEDTVVIDAAFTVDIVDVKPFSVLTLAQSIETLEKLVGRPDSETSKSLFEIVAALNRELLELRLKVEEINGEKS